MEIDKEIREIPLNDIQQLEWLTTRSSDTDILQLDQLSHSLQPLATPTTGSGAIPKSGQMPDAIQPILNNLHESLEPSLFTISLGQLSPIRVLKFPPEIDHLRTYGLICGLRRVLAARQAGLTTSHAQIVRLSADEYRDPTIQLRLFYLAYYQHPARTPLRFGDRIMALKTLKDYYNTRFPNHTRKAVAAAKPRDDQGHLQASTAKPAEKRFTQVAAKILGLREREIYDDIHLAEHLCTSLIKSLNTGEITKSAAMILAKISPEQQSHAQELLAKKHEPPTIANITRIVDRIRER